MNSSGLTALGTSGDDPIVLLSPNGTVSTNLVLVVTDQVPFGLSLDGGGTWGYCPGASSSSVPFTLNLIVHVGAQAVMLKRVPSGTDLSGVWAWSA